MSYDVSVGDFDANMTSNIASLFYDHIPASDSRGGLHELHGKTGKRAAAILADAFERINSQHMRDWSEVDVGDSVFCARYDSPNGWGSTVGGLIFLARLMAACREHPRAKVRLYA